MVYCGTSTVYGKTVTADCGTSTVYSKTAIVYCGTFTVDYKIFFPAALAGGCF
jgi:hypothetical protein